MLSTRRNRSGLAIGLALVIAGWAAVASAQSGRKPETVKPPAPTEEKPLITNESTETARPVAEETNEIYRCTDDSSYVRLVGPVDEGEVFTPKAVDVRALIESRPKAGYTREARRAGVQGSVVLNLVLLSNGNLGSIRVLKGLPAGLTGSAIRAACRLKFRPAIKEAREVSQSLQIEYTYRLSDHRIMKMKSVR